MAMDSTSPLQDYSPHAQLVAALLPRAAGLSIFNPAGDLLWTSDETVPPQLPVLVARGAALAELNDEPGERVQLRSDEPAYLFWVRDAGRKPLAVMCVRWRNSENDPRTFSYVHAMLRPVIECATREIALQAKLAGRAAAELGDAEHRDADLKVLLTTADVPTGSADIAQLLGHVNMHMGCEFTALLMPERNLVVVTRTEGRDVDTSVLARAHRHLMSLAQLGKEALLLNEPGSLPGVTLPLRALVSAVRNPGGRPHALLVMFRNREAAEFRRRDGLLADLLVRRAAAVIESRYDALTGLFTRQAFEARARAMRIERPAGPWCFLFIDADRLQAINDYHGMAVGDRLLVRLGELIRTRLAPGGAAARITGDHFAILLPASETDAAAFAEALRAGIAGLSAQSLGAMRDTGLQSSLSIGVAPVDADAPDVMVALEAAEAACRAAKKHGRNRVEHFAPGCDATVLTHSVDAVAEASSDTTAVKPDVAAAAVRQILDGDRLSLHAQLIAPLPGNVAPTPHFELLLRVQDEQGELVGPGSFLSECRRLGLMSAVDRWVMRETLELLKPHAALLEGGAVVLTVNLSGQSLADPAFAGDLLAMVRDSGIDARALCLEFGEADVIEHFAAAEPLMHQLRDLGCQIALDDFGTGMASLASLRSLPLTMLKIDGSFVRDLLKDPRAEGLVSGMIHLANSANAATVAECVETDEIRVRLAAMGVAYGQGFAIARPVPLADAIRDLPTWASVAKQRDGGDVVLGDADDTVSAALQKELQRELLAGGVDPALLDDDLESAMQRLIDDSRITAAELSALPEGEVDAEKFLADVEATAEGDAQTGGNEGELSPRQAAG